MLPFFFAAEPPASTPDTLLIVDMLLLALGSGLPEPGAVWAGSACYRHMPLVSPLITLSAGETDLNVAQQDCHLQQKAPNHCTSMLVQQLRTPMHISPKPSLVPDSGQKPHDGKIGKVTTEAVFSSISAA